MPFCLRQQSVRRTDARRCCRAARRRGSCAPSTPRRRTSSETANPAATARSAPDRITCVTLMESGGLAGVGSSAGTSGETPRRAPHRFPRVEQAVVCCLLETRGRKKINVVYCQTCSAPAECVLPRVDGASLCCDFVGHTPLLDGSPYSCLAIYRLAGPKKATRRTGGGAPSPLASASAPSDETHSSPGCDTLSRQQKPPPCIPGGGVNKGQQQVCLRVASQLVCTLLVAAVPHFQARLPIIS